MLFLLPPGMIVDELGQVRLRPATPAPTPPAAAITPFALHHGDMLEVLTTFGDCSIDACVTDPPYHLASIVKRFGKPNSVPAQFGSDGRYARVGAGFMGKTWDGDIAFDPVTWQAVYRVLKPGAHLVAFGGTRTSHRLVCAIEDAGFEIRDQLGWVFSQGFPKSHDAGDGWGTALKPAWENICLARKPLSGTVVANRLKKGTGALNIEASRVPASSGAARWPANLIHDDSEEVLALFPQTPGQLAKASTSNTQHVGQNVYGATAKGSNGREPRGDTGSAARFFYCAKASQKDRAGSKHPTVKPLALLRYLVLLVTPPGGRVLDPFAGSGTTLQVAVEAGFFAIGIEKEAEYIADIERRMADI